MNIIDPELKKKFDQAFQNYKQGKLKNAEILYKKILDTYPHHLPSLINLALMFEQKKKFKESIKYYKKVIIRNSNHIIAHFNLGSIYNNLGEQEEAIKLFKKVVKINPNFILAQKNIGMIYMKNFDWEKAENIFIEVLKKNKKLIEIQYTSFLITNIKKIINFEKKKNFIKVIQESEKLISIDPVKIEPYLYCLKSLIKLKKNKTKKHIFKITKILGANNIVEKFFKKENINLKFLKTNA